VGEPRGGEVGHPGVGEFGDLRRDRALVPDDGHVARPGTVLRHGFVGKVVKE
jgi:hypothetical protein